MVLSVFLNMITLLKICLCWVGSLLVFIVSAPGVQVVDHVQDPTVVTDDVKVPVVDEGPVVLKTEYDVVTAVVHEVVDH